MALALTLSAVAAQAGENHEHRAPLVLNGRLNTSDFTGGVGGAPYGGYVQASVYVSGASNNPYAATTAFIAAARTGAFSGSHH